MFIFVSFLICRYKGVYEYCKSKGIDLGKPVGLDVVVDGTVPQGTIQWLINL
jgi:N-acetylgalactosamine kinase